ncbi:MAG: transposase [Firmicutes bacterium]|nr:transposase [Bacillota bacterium]
MPEHQCGETGTVLVTVDCFFPCKTCASCGLVYEELSLKGRRWMCPGCNATCDKDIHAVINIHRVGTSTFKGEVARPAPGAFFHDAGIPRIFRGEYVNPPVSILSCRAW